MDDLFVDTSSWSLLFRRDREVDHPVARRLSLAIAHDEDLCTTGLVLQELLQGFPRKETEHRIIDRFASVDLLRPTRADHIQAAEIVNECRRNGIQIKTVDALLAALCLRGSLTMLSADRDFEQIARHVPLRCWDAAA